MNIFFTVDENDLVYPCCDDNGQDGELEWIRGSIEAPAYEEHGIPRWKYVDGSCVLRSDEEIQADVDELPMPEPTSEELLRADVDYLLMLMEE